MGYGDGIPFYEGESTALMTPHAPGEDHSDRTTDGVSRTLKRA